MPNLVHLNIVNCQQSILSCNIKAQLHLKLMAIDSVSENRKFLIVLVVNWLIIMQ